jgi:hypothetical protein
LFEIEISRLTEAKIKEVRLVGSQVEELIRDNDFDKVLNVGVVVDCDVMWTRR